MSRWLQLGKPPPGGLIPFSAPKTPTQRQNLKQYLAYETSRNARKHFPRRADVETFFGQRWQMDVADIGGNISFNIPAVEKKPKLYALVMIDLFSKTIYAKALKNKTATTTAHQLRAVLQRLPQWKRPDVIESDAGGEFNNKQVKELLSKEFHITLKLRGGIHKNEVIERAIRSFKKIAVLYLESHPESFDRWKQRWERVVPKIAKLMNHRTHRHLDMAPEDVMDQWRRVQKKVLKRMKVTPFETYLALQTALIEGKKIKDGSQEFGLHDWVLVRHEKHDYEKETVRNYLTKPWQIQMIAVDRTPYTYMLQDEHGKSAKRAYYAAELIRLTRKPLKGRRPIKKIIQEKTEKGKKMWLVQYLDDPRGQEEWIPARKEYFPIPRQSQEQVKKRGRPPKKVSSA